MNLHSSTLEDLFNYFTNQVYKILGLFEEDNQEGFKHIGKTIDELEGLVFVINEVGEDYRYLVLQAKLEWLYTALYYMDDEHSEIKNHVFESIKLLKQIREGLSK